MQPFLRPEWPAPPQVRALTTLRRGAGVGLSLTPFDAFNLGARCGDDPVAVARNRVALCDIAALPQEPHWLSQVHGVAVLSSGRPHPNPPPQAGEGVIAASLQPLPPLAGEVWDGGGFFHEPEADAVVTSTAGEVLAILSADCLPVLFCAADGREIGAAHAGWRGLAAGVLEHTVAAMHVPASELMAWLGPAAGPLAYEIGEEVRAAFVDHDARAATAFVPTRPGHWHVDLFALARQRLQQIGVTRTYGGGLCTISDPQRFYSHRRDGRTGRMATLIWIGADV